MTLYLYLVEAKSELLLEKYDTYDSFVVCCESEKEARQTLPSGGRRTPYNENKMCWIQTNGRIVGTDKYNTHGWILGKDIDKLKVRLLGNAVEGTERDVICASYNAG